MKYLHSFYINLISKLNGYYSIFLFVILPLVVFNFLILLIIYSFENYFYISLTVLILVFLFFIIDGTIRRKLENKRGWRTGRIGRDEYFYEELHDGGWRRLVIYAEMMCGVDCDHYVGADPDEFPEWAKNNKYQICQRFMSQHPEPKFEYEYSLKWKSAQQVDTPEPMTSVSKTRDL